MQGSPLEHLTDHASPLTGHLARGIQRKELVRRPIVLLFDHMQDVKEDIIAQSDVLFTGHYCLFATSLWRVDALVVQFKGGGWGEGEPRK